MWLNEWKKFKMLRVLIKTDDVNVYTPNWELIKNPVWPLLVLSEKEWDDYKNTVYKSFDGKFKELKEYSYESKKDWKTYTGINLVMEDNGEEYQLSIWWNAISRSLVNSLAWTTEPLTTLRISVYGKVSGDKTFPCISIYNNWQPTKWKYSIDEQKTMIELVTTSKWSFNDYGKYEDALKTHIEAINNNIKSIESEINFWDESVEDKLRAKANTVEDANLPF